MYVHLFRLLKGCFTNRLVGGSKMLVACSFTKSRQWSPAKKKVSKHLPMWTETSHTIPAALSTFGPFVKYVCMCILCIGLLVAPKFSEKFCIFAFLPIQILLGTSWGCGLKAEKWIWVCHLRKCQKPFLEFNTKKIVQMNKQFHCFTVNGVTRPLFNRSRLKSFLWTVCFFLFFLL